MKATTTLALVLASVGFLGLVYRLTRDDIRLALDASMSRRGLEQPLKALGEADEKLGQALRRRIGGGSDSDREIDLRQPTEMDLLFLHDTLREGTLEARASAARALVEIQEPRAVGWLSRATGSQDEEALFCSAALEILRFQTRERASELMLDVLLDAKSKASATCQPQLEEKLTFISGRALELLPALLDGQSDRVKRYALEALPPTSDAGVQARVQALVDQGSPEISALAMKWLEKALDPSGTPVRAGEPTSQE